MIDNERGKEREKDRVRWIEIEKKREKKRKGEKDNEKIKESVGVREKGER